MKPTKRKDGRWMLQLPRVPGESRRSVYGRSESECEAKYARALGFGEVEVRPGSISEFVVTTFVPWLIGRVQPESMKRYDQIWRGQVGPKFGHLLFCELEPAIVQDGLMAGGSASTRQNSKGLLSQIVRLAIAHGIADPKHLAMVTIARVGSRPAKARVNVADKAQNLLDAAKGTDLEGPVYCAMTLGLRLAEVCGMMPTDINIAKGVLTISRQRKEAGVKDRLKSKAQSAPRAIGVPESILGRLLSYHRPGSIFLFTREDGSPVSYHWLSRQVSILGKEFGVTFHDMRSAAISVLVDAGVDDYTIMDITGHTTLSMVRAYRDSREERTKTALTNMVDI